MDTCTNLNNITGTIVNDISDMLISTNAKGLTYGIQSDDAKVLFGATASSPNLSSRTQARTARFDSSDEKNNLAHSNSEYKIFSVSKIPKAAFNMISRDAIVSKNLPEDQHEVAEDTSNLIEDTYELRKVFLETSVKTCIIKPSCVTCANIYKGNSKDHLGIFRRVNA